MNDLKEISIDQVHLVRVLAERIWPDTFKEILSQAQIRYMLDWMYSEKTLAKQIEQGHHFYVLEENQEEIGFLGVEANYPETGKLRIHKIYILPEKQGQGFGRKMIEFAKVKAKALNCASLHLNVNRFNAAVEFYKRIGFVTLKEEDIDIGNGYLMEDFVMELTVD